VRPEANVSVLYHSLLGLASERFGPPVRNGRYTANQWDCDSYWKDSIHPSVVVRVPRSPLHGRNPDRPFSERPTIHSQLLPTTSLPGKSDGFTQNPPKITSGTDRYSASFRRFLLPGAATTSDQHGPRAACSLRTARQECHASTRISCLPPKPGRSTAQP
jgi:hypothetical protein